MPDWLAGCWGWLGTKAGDWFMDTWVRSRCFRPTDIPACVGHHIVHNNSFLGAIGGLIGGLIVGLRWGLWLSLQGARHWVCWLPPLLPVPGISWWICRWRSDGNWFPLGI
ncbi:hypothetical protein ACVXG8_12535 [Escherichia coli]